MRKVHAMLAAAVLGTSALAMPVRADEFKKTTMDDIPREARDAIRDKTKNKDDVEVFTRRMSDGETQYTTFYMDGGRRMEMRVDKDGKVVSPAHETREQPADKKDKDKDNKDDVRTDNGVVKDYHREPEQLEDMPKPVQETMNRETAGATDQGYFRLRRDGDDTYSVFFTPANSERQEMRVDKNGKVLSHHPGDPDAVANAPAKHDENKNDDTDAAQTAGNRVPPVGAPLPPPREAGAVGLVRRPAARGGVKGC